ncbi:terminase large subunit domain-containing protein [Candidatus Nitrosotenuis aquarius]|uniref:terminase large subunit domain-containing protein n=1 Tax=Candidatus Nitrosotenuis aquarius TaxID=1846278 RepID=UPI0013C35978|nr:terminase family protein [Candidatus Nitrosotenuis aquarius]
MATAVVVVERRGRLQTGMTSMNLQKRISMLEARIKKSSSTPSVPADFVQFNEMIGPPIHPKTKQPTKIFDYQSKLDRIINQYHRVMLNKSRKIGATETGLRSIAKNCFDRYAGGDIMIVAGNRQRQADRLLDRFDKLFWNGFVDLNGNEWKYSDLIIKKTSSTLEFFNGTTIHTFPAAPEALRGSENVVCVFLDEAAHFKLVDDRVIYDALEPNIANTEGDFICISTPNGRRGFFYDLWIEENEYYKLAQPYTVSYGLLLSESYINSKKNDLRIDFEQEFNCQFTTSQNAAFPAGLFASKTLEDYELVSL